MRAPRGARQIPGAGVPTGAVTSELLRKKKPKVLGTASVSGGTAILPAKPTSVLKKSIMILHSGEVDFQASTLTAKLISGSLISTARSMVRVSKRR
jgi:hypothetical protein